MGQSDSVSVLDTSVKAGKATKTPKAPKGGGVNGQSNDPVTGLSADFDGIGRIISDKLITIDGWQTEYEFGDTFVVETKQRKSEDTQQIRRYVYEGSFSYDNNILSSGQVSSSWRMHIDQDPQYLSKSAIVNLPTNQNIGNIREPGWDSLFEGGKVEYFTTELDGPSAMERYSSYAGGRFFQEGWWNNPFVPNLI
jgi:hypothetical protein